LNRVQLEGLLKQKFPLRYTLAGLPALEAVLAVQEAARPEFDVGIAGFGDWADALNKLPLGSTILVTGRLQKAQKTSAKLNILIEALTNIESVEK
jgi:primosomal replication protein N